MLKVHKAPWVGFGKDLKGYLGMRFMYFFIYAVGGDIGSKGCV